MAIYCMIPTIKHSRIGRTMRTVSKEHLLLPGVWGRKGGMSR